MKIAKSVVVGVVAVASLALVAACGDKGGSSTPATGPSAPPSPTKTLSGAEQFAAAATKTTATTYKFKATLTGGGYEGATDPTAGATIGKISVEVEPGTTLTIESQLSESAYYLKVTGLPLPGLDGKKWLKVDPAKVTSREALSFGDAKDPLDLKDLSGNIATAETTDGKSIKGTFDFTKKTWGPIDDDTVKGLADKAKTVPFEATVDDKGNLAAVKVSVPAYGDEKANEIAVTFSDFGSPVTVTAPATSDVEDAPAAVYSLLNGA